MKQVVLLRAVNVGGKNKVPMRELVDIMKADGFVNPTFYIQSGNLIFEQCESPTSRIEALIKQHFNVNTTAIVRNVDELSNIIANCPYSDENAYVTVLSGTISEFAKVDGQADEYTHCGDVVYICMNGPAHLSKLQNAVFEKRTGLVATTRNIRTMKEIYKRCLVTAD